MKRTWALGAMLLASATLGCWRQGAPPDLVAMVAERPVRWAEVEAELRSQAAEETAALSSPILSMLLDAYLDEIVLDQYARLRGWGDADPVVTMLEAELEARPVDAEDVAAAYAARADQFDLPARLRLRQLLLPDRPTAEEAARRLAAGDDFLVVSQALSQDPNASQGGIQPGTFTAEELPPPFADTLLALAEGEVSPILQAPHGFHIFQVTERLAAEVLPLELARDELAETLRREQADGLLQELLEEARLAVPCRIFEHNLPFSYQGRYADAGTQSE